MSMPLQNCSYAEYNSATAYGSTMSNNDRKTTTTTQINDNSHNSVNITNIYYQAHVRREDEEGIKWHGS